MAGAALADRARQAPRLYTEADGWRPLQIWGMGIASQDIDRRRPSRGLPHQPGRQQAPDAGRRRGRPDYHGHRARTRAPPRTRPYRGGDDAGPPRPGTPSSQDVNNDGFVDLFVTKGNVEASPTTPPGPEQPAPRPARRHLRRGRRGGGIVDYARAAGRRWSTSTSTACSTSSWSPPRERHAVAQRRRGRAPSARADGSLAGTCGSSSRRRTRCDRRVDRGRGRRRRHRPRGDRRWRPRRRPARLDRTSASGRPSRPRSASQWPDGEVGPWQSLPADGFAIIERGADAVRPWTPGAD